MEKCDKSNRKSCQVEATCLKAVWHWKNKRKKSLKSFINCCTKSAGPKNRKKLIFVHKNVSPPRLSSKINKSYARCYLSNFFIYFFPRSSSRTIWSGEKLLTQLEFAHTSLIVSQFFFLMAFFAANFIFHVFVFLHPQTGCTHCVTAVEKLHVWVWLWRVSAAREIFTLFFLSSHKLIWL